MYRKNLVFLAACLGMLLFGIVFISLGSMVNWLAARFSLNDSSIGTLTVLLPAGMLAASLIFGPIVDRYGYKLLLVVCSLIVFVSLEGIAMAKSIGAVQFFILLIGFGGGVLNGATNALVADISAGERGAKLSLLGVFFGIGALSMPGILGMLSGHFSQQSIVVGIGFFVLLPTLYFLLIRFPAAKQGKGASFKESVALLKEPTLLLIGLILALQSGMEGMCNDWTPRYFSKVLGIADKQALLALTVLVASLTATRVLLGFILKRVPSSYVLFVSLSFIAFGALFLRSQPPANTVMLAIVSIGVGLAAAFPVLLGVIGDLYSEKSGTAFSIVFVIALLGNMGVNKTMGHVGQAYGTQHFVHVLLSCIILSAILLAVILKRINKNNPGLINKNEQSRETVAR